MEPNQQTTQLLNKTLDTFKGDAKAINPTDGISLVDNWISALHSGDASTNPVANTLSELKVELQQDKPDSETIRSIVEQLATQAKGAADSANGEMQSALTNLSAALQNFCQQLDDSVVNSRANQNTNQTTTNTHSIEGTYSTDMDDQTGSNGGMTGDGENVQAGGAYGSGYGTGSDGQKDAPNSGTAESTTADTSEASSENETDPAKEGQS